jgi:hypothetical protein
MFGRLMKATSELWRKMLHTPDVNSRVVFLAHTAVAVLGTVVLVIAFIFAKDKTGYDSMILSLNGGAGLMGGAVGRYLTKKGTKEEAPEDDHVENPQV